MFHPPALQRPAAFRSISAHQPIACGILIPLLAVALATSAAGQDASLRVASGRAMSYASESPHWLQFIAKSGKSRTKSAWPSWKMPRWTSSSSSGWWTSSSGASSYSRNNKTMMQKMNQSAKRTWNKTLDILDPYPEPKSSPEKSSSWFSNMFSSKESDSSFSSVSDWGKQPMPK